MHRVFEVAGEYLLDTIDTMPGGVFIDCGSNIGELGLWARKIGLAYIAFEPEVLEARYCDPNNFEGSTDTRCEALRNEATTLTFYASWNRSTARSSSWTRISVGSKCRR